MYRQWIIAVIAAISLGLVACDDYDTFTTDRSATLQFSHKEVVFDTLITTIPSSTQTLAVYNRGDKGLRISEVALAGGNASPFRVNIDGQDMSRSAENRVSDFEVRRRDSIIVRIEVTLPDTDNDNPHQVADDLIFTLESGVQQRVSLSVVGQDAYIFRHQTLTTNTTLTANRPYVIYDSLVVAQAVTLTLEAGAQLLFHDGAGLKVDGSLKATGTLDKPVVLRGDRTDHMFDYLPYDRLPSRWEGVVFTKKSTGNELNYVDLHGGSYGIRCEESALTDLKLKLLNSRFYMLGGDGLAATDCRVEIANCEISNTLGHCVRLTGGDAQFIHCTLTQFYPLDVNRGKALYISCYEDSTYHALQRAEFVNSVITGYADDVVIFPALDGSAVPGNVVNPQINYDFQNCFMATVVPAGDVYANRFRNIIYDPTGGGENSHQKNFQLFNTHDFLYDFTPIASSPIRGTADPAYSTAYPLDRLGRSRTTDNAPDAGCYEFVESPATP